VGDPTPAVDGSTDFDIDPWLAGSGPELASFEFDPGRSTTSAVIPETHDWKSSSIPSMKVITSASCTGFAAEVLHGNVTDFEAFASITA